MEDIRKKVLVFEQSSTLAHAYELAFLGSEWELILVEDESLLLQIAASEMPDVVVIEQSRISEETLAQLDEVGFALLCSGCRELHSPFMGLLPRPFSVTELFPALQETMNKSLAQASDGDIQEDVGEDVGEDVPEDVGEIVDDGITEDTFSPEEFASEPEEAAIEIISDDEDDDDDDLIVLEAEDDDDEVVDEVVVEAEIEVDTDDDVETEMEVEAEMEVDTDDDVETEMEVEADDDVETEIEVEAEMEVDTDDDVEIEMEADSINDDEITSPFDIDDSEQNEEMEIELETDEDEDELMEFDSGDVLSLENPHSEEPSQEVPAIEDSLTNQVAEEESETPEEVAHLSLPTEQAALPIVLDDALRTMIKEMLWEMAPAIIKQAVEEKITELYTEKE